MEKEISSFDELKNCNSHYISEADYVNYVLNIAKSPADIMRSFSEVYFPNFKLEGDLVFNVSFGCHEVYLSNIAKGMTKIDAYYWSHVIDVGGRFLISVEDADAISDYMCDSWNASLKKLNFSRFNFSKQVDEEEVLIFPTIDRSQ